mmetsp:Transcript_98219/g.274980  ORF Transcript_98219/g.274980 Transcript_98219/m.274980 type:complete len:206 (-) Transcript_98219:698-1315(-)
MAQHVDGVAELVRQDPHLLHGQQLGVAPRGRGELQIHKDVAWADHSRAGAVHGRWTETPGPGQLHIHEAEALPGGVLEIICAHRWPPARLQVRVPRDTAEADVERLADDVGDAVHHRLGGKVLGEFEGLLLPPDPRAQKSLVDDVHIPEPARGLAGRRLCGQCGKVRRPRRRQVVHLLQHRLEPRACLPPTALQQRMRFLRLAHS